MSDEIVEGQMALALGRPQIPLGQQPAEPPVGGAVPGIGENVGRSVGEGQPRARDDAQGADRRSVLAREDMGAHHAGERIAIGDANPGKPEPRRLRDQFLGMRGAAQKRKIGRRREFGEARLGADHTSPPSPEQPVQEPFGAGGFASVEPFAIEPEAVAPRVLGVEIVAGQRVVAPPFGGDPLGAFDGGDLMQDAGAI